MATKLKRATNIIEAFNDILPEEEKVNKIINAFAYTYQRNEELTQAEKASEFIKQIRLFTRQIVKDYNQSVAVKNLLDTNNFDINLGDD